MDANPKCEAQLAFSAHAEGRLWERGFSPEDVADLLARPHITFDGDPRHGLGRVVHAFDEARIVTSQVQPDGRIHVITVMWRNFGSDAARCTRRAA
jgi:hypothetical protein